MHSFYIGKEILDIDTKFNKIRRYLVIHEDIKKGSRAECYRWMVNKLYKLIIEKENGDEGS